MSREVMQQALEALENSSDVIFQNVTKSALRGIAIAALREALAAPPPAQPAELSGNSGQLPVAWMRPSEEGYDSAFRDHRTVMMCKGNPWKNWVPLYTAPPAQRQAQKEERQPLTDEEIDRLALDYSLPHSTRSFARAIEAAHGIKEKNT